MKLTNVNPECSRCKHLKMYHVNKCHYSECECKSFRNEMSV